ncbi:MAG: amidohydrolase [Nocardioidaceae bacterium]
MPKPHAVLTEAHGRAETTLRTQATGRVVVPRVLLRGGIICAPSVPAATAMFTVDSQIVWLGDDDTASTYADTADLVVELDGKLVTPGFVDAHVHLAQTGFALQALDLSASLSLADALAQLATFARGHVGAVLFGHGWDESRWPEGRAMTIIEVDAAVGDQAAYLGRVDAHSGVVSSALVRQQPDVVDCDGWHGDGVVERDAHHAVRDVTARLRSAADRRHALQVALARAAASGITSLHEVNAPHISPVGDFALLRDMAAATAIPEVVPYWGSAFGEGIPADAATFGFAGDLCVDGSIGSRTASLHAPYADADTCGHLYLSADQVRDHVVFCSQRNTQAGFHVIGDLGMHTVVAGLTAAAEIVGDTALIRSRHRLEHAEMIDPEQIAALARLGVVASVQPAFDAAWGASGQLYEQRLGLARAYPMNPFASMRRAGVTLAFGSDSPVTTLDPWAAMRAAVFHHNVDERLTVEAAFDAHTRGGHRARRDDAGGVLEVGAEASYAVWDVAPDARGAGRVPGEATRLPQLHPDLPLPRCVHAVASGAVVFATEDAL